MKLMILSEPQKKGIKLQRNFMEKLKDNDQIYLSNYEGCSIRDEAFYLESELSKTKMDL